MASPAVSSNDSLARLAAVIETRRAGDPDKSYVARLFAKGGDAVLKRSARSDRGSSWPARWRPAKVVAEVADLCSTP